MSHVLMIFAPSGKQVVCQSTLIDLLFQFKKASFAMDMDGKDVPEFSEGFAYRLQAYADGKFVADIITDAVTYHLENDPNIVVDRVRIFRHRGAYDYLERGAFGD